MSIVPATVRVKSLTFLCSSVGFIIISLLTSPTFTAAVGPPNGISEIDNAQDAPIIAAISGELSCSTESTVATITTSFLKSFGNKGLNGLSIALDVKIALAVTFTITTVSPYLTNTLPFAKLAILPVSTLNFLPANSVS